MSRRNIVTAVRRQAIDDGLKVKLTHFARSSFGAKHRAPELLPPAVAVAVMGAWREYPPLRQFPKVALPCDDLDKGPGDRHRRGLRLPGIEARGRR